MLFSVLVRHLEEENRFHIEKRCASDRHEIRDVELLDGTQESYLPSVVYFGYSDALSPIQQPQQCILVESKGESL